MAAPAVTCEAVPVVGVMPSAPTAPEGRAYVVLECGHRVLVTTARAVAGGSACCYVCERGLGVERVIVTA